MKTCPTGAIHFGTKESMKTLASERVAELKTRGYDNAGLYDPAGVGGTHVMYVLHHADKPNLYHGLPENPEISETVKFWKGIWKTARGCWLCGYLCGQYLPLRGCRSEPCG